VITWDMDDIKIYFYLPNITQCLCLCLCLPHHFIRSIHLPSASLPKGTSARHVSPHPQHGGRLLPHATSRLSRGTESSTCGTVASELQVPMVTLPVCVNGIWERTAGNGEKETAVTQVTGVKPKVHHRTGLEGPEEEESYSSTLSLTSALDRGGCSTPRPGRFTTRENAMVRTE
jgi:hypothetical protein